MDKTDKYISVKDIGKVCHLHEEGDIEIFEIVRCKDCRYYQSDGEWYDDDVCKVHPDDDNGYCAWGERREDAETD